MYCAVFQNALCVVSGCISTIVGLFETATGHADLLLALTETVSSVAQGSRENQNAFVDDGVTQHIVNVILNQVSCVRAVTVWHDVILNQVSGVSVVTVC